MMHGPIHIRIKYLFIILFILICNYRYLNIFMEDSKYFKIIRFLPLKVLIFWCIRNKVYIIILQWC